MKILVFEKESLLKMLSVHLPIKFIKQWMEIIPLSAFSLIQPRHLTLFVIKKLLDALDDIGIRGTTLKLMDSYLLDRKQYVMINDVSSDEESVCYGVPQGSIFGPILFIIYLNNLLTLNTSGSILSFADDTAVFYTDNSWSNLKKQLENDLAKIIDWFNHMTFIINFTKPRFLALFRRIIQEKLSGKEVTAALPLQCLYNTAF